MAKVMPLNAPDARKMKRLGFLAGRLPCPTTSTGWATPRSSSCSAVRVEVVAGYPSAHSGGRSEGIMRLTVDPTVAQYPGPVRVV